MRPIPLSLIPLALAAVAAPLGAQEPAPKAPQRVTGTAPYRVVTVRPTLGIVVGTEAGTTDSIGARVESVTPGGPAHRAGIRSGDIITRVDGFPLVMTAPPGVRVASPGLRLIERMAQRAPGDTVLLQLRRGSDTRTVHIATEPRRDVMVYVTEPDRQREAMLELRGRLEDMPAIGQRYSFLASPLGNLQLAPLNPDLGRYFGVGEGVLVISVPSRSGLPLRGGDVVLRVDGREPESPGHLLRILSSYDQDEEFRLDIVRDRKRRSVTGKVGGRP